MTGFADHAAPLLLAILIDALVGDPDWLYRRILHPVAVFGMLIGRLEAVANRDVFSDAVRRGLGSLAVAILLTLAGTAGWMIHAGLASLPYGRALEALAIFPFLAQNSLYRHVADVASALSRDGLDAARMAVARIVGRDPDSLDEAGIGRAAIESLAENYADGVLAPVFWYLLFGLPGLTAYKALNTADSMIGHRDARYRAFGWAAARLDDLANYVPARLAALFLVFAAAVTVNAHAGKAGWSALRDAGKHRSVNAGWPEAAMAGALGLRLAGPRRYGSQMVDDSWIGDGHTEAGAADIAAALRLYCMACLLTAFGVAGLAVIG